MMYKQAVLSSNAAVLPPGDARNQQKRNILVADDDADVRAMIVRTLGLAGFAVLEACDGHEALRLYQSRQSEIDLVVTDLEMPVMTGLEAITRMKAINSKVRVLMISGRSDLPLLLHASCSLAKPFGRTQLVNAVRTAMSSSEDPPANSI